MKVQVIQCDVAWMNPEKNLELLENELSMSDADLVVMPEMFLTGFNMEAAEASIEIGGEWWLKLLELSSHYSQMFCGSIAVKENDKYYNRAVLLHNGKVIHSYDKNYLFSYSKEDRAYTPGSGSEVFNVNGWNIVFQICYDLRFPERIRNLESIDLIIYMANWPETRIDHWKKLLMARAIENQCYVIGCNRVGVDGNEWDYSGSSMIVDYNGRVEVAAGNHSISPSATLSLTFMHDFRNRYPFQKDKKMK